MTCDNDPANTFAIKVDAGNTFKKGMTTGGWSVVSGTGVYAGLGGGGNIVGIAQDGGGAGVVGPHRPLHRPGPLTDSANEARPVKAGLTYLTYRPACPARPAEPSGPYHRVDPYRTRW